MWEHLFKRKKAPAIEDKCQAETNGSEPGDNVLAIPPQPSKNERWVLTLGECEDRIVNPSWETVKANLHRLCQASVSFLILEQKTSQSPPGIWFIQCAVAIKGPHQDEYAVEIGFNTSDGHYLWEHMVPDIQAAIAYFSDAYHYRNIEMSGFRPM